MLAYFTSSLTWLSINQNSLWCRMRFSADKNLSVVVKFFFCHSPGCPVIHNPRQVCVDLVNINSRGLFPWNDFDSVFGFIKGSQLFLALFEAYRICKQEFFTSLKQFLWYGVKSKTGILKSSHLANMMR